MNKVTSFLLGATFLFTSFLSAQDGKNTSRDFFASMQHSIQNVEYDAKDSLKELKKLSEIAALLASSTQYSIDKRIELFFGIDNTINEIIKGLGQLSDSHISACAIIRKKLKVYEQELIEQFKNREYFAEGIQKVEGNGVESKVDRNDSGNLFENVRSFLKQHSKEIVVCATTLGALALTLRYLGSRSNQPTTSPKNFALQNFKQFIQTQGGELVINPQLLKLQTTALGYNNFKKNFKKLYEEEFNKLLIQRNKNILEKKWKQLWQNAGVTPPTIEQLTTQPYYFDNLETTFNSYTYDLEDEAKRTLAHAWDACKTKLYFGQWNRNKITALIDALDKSLKEFEAKKKDEQNRVVKDLEKQKKKADKEKQKLKTKLDSVKNQLKKETTKVSALDTETKRLLHRLDVLRGTLHDMNHGKQFLNMDKELKHKIRLLDAKIKDIAQERDKAKDRLDSFRQALQYNEENIDTIQNFDTVINGIPGCVQNLPATLAVSKMQQELESLEKQQRLLRKKVNDLSKQVIKLHVELRTARKSKPNVRVQDSDMIKVVCPICLTKYGDDHKPVVLNCGHHVCVNGLKNIKKTNHVCPICRENITSSQQLRL